jgi:hypothetical protein
MNAGPGGQVNPPRAAQPLRGTQSLVGQMGWVMARPSLTLIEVAWRWVFGIPYLAICWWQLQQIFAFLPPQAAGLSEVDAQNPWVAVVQLDHAWTLYRPHLLASLNWLLPVAALMWAVVSGFGRSVVLKRMEPKLGFKPAILIVLQAAWLTGLGLTWWGWLRSVEWAAQTHITAAAEPDLVGYSVWVIFLSLGFFTAWALVSWALSIAPLLVLFEGCSAVSALGQSVRLGKPFTSKLVEINMVMGIVNLALMVLAMVFSAAPLPFSDELGGDTLHVMWAASAVFYLVASDYFQVVRLKGFVEFWKMFRGSGAAD